MRISANSKTLSGQVFKKNQFPFRPLALSSTHQVLFLHMLSLGESGGDMQLPDAGHPRLSRGHKVSRRMAAAARELSIFPPPFSPAHGRTRGWREPTPVLSKLSAAVSMPRSGSPQPPLLFLLPYAAESSRNKCVQRFISCAKPKQNFHTSSSTKFRGRAGSYQPGGRDSCWHSGPIAWWARGA